MSLNIEKLRTIRNYVCYFFSNWIVIRGYFKFNQSKLLPNNFGDDINFELLQTMTSKKIVDAANKHLWRVPHLLCIGSIIDLYMDEKSIVWGSGVMYGTKPLLGKPRKVYAVRGKLSRKYLIDHDIECPPIYGDPALLLPIIYNPTIQKKYRYGIIAHYVDYNLPHVKKFREAHNDILFIKMQDYSSWKEVVDQINSCEFIFSSSLHGLIVSDAYKVPNMYVKFSNLVNGGEYKYKDYFSGVEREYFPPLDWTEVLTIDETVSYSSLYKSINYNVLSLIKSFPYRISPEFYKKVNLFCQSQ